MHSHFHDKEAVPWGPFPTPFKTRNYGEGAVPKALVELELLALSGAIREKDNWFEKMWDDEIVGKWKEEALAQGASEEVFNYVLEELRYYDKLRDGTIEPAAVDGVWKADGIVPEEITQALIEGVAKLENVPEEAKDWHPGSNNQVNF